MATHVLSLILDGLKPDLQPH